MAVVCASLGFRISECLALRWSDVDWLRAKICIRSGIVNQNVDDVKTVDSGGPVSISNELLQELEFWKGSSEFSGENDWIFASPLKLGRLPYSYTGFWRELDRAGKEAGVGHLGTHSFRHSYRSWLDAVGTSIGVQQKLMRHADIRTTMNVYGDVVTNEMQLANQKVAELALRGQHKEIAIGLRGEATS